MPTVPTPATKAGATAKVKGRMAGSLGSLIDEIWAVREKKRELQEKLAVIEAEISGKEEALLDRLEAEGVKASTGKKASVSISTSVVANVTDWDAFYAFIYKNKLGHLLQRRVSDPAFRELLESKGKVPGAEPFSKTRLNIRTLNP